MDEAEVLRIEAQLTLWSEEIKRREARLLTPGRESRFTAVLHVDELRVMLVTAQTRLEAVQADSTGNRDPLMAEFNRSWQELEAAIGRRMPRP